MKKYDIKDCLYELTYLIQYHNILQRNKYQMFYTFMQNMFHNVHVSHSCSSVPIELRVAG